MGPIRQVFSVQKSLVYKGGPSKGAECGGLNECANGQCDASVNSVEGLARGGCAEGQALQRTGGLN